MKLPKVIMHNSISLDGAVNDFEVDMGLHYQIAGTYKADAHLIGSDTIKVGMQLYGTEIPPEEKTDFTKPKKETGLPLWVIPDTKGTLQGMLHYLRRTEFCKDVIILISQTTSKKYIQYLEKRNYDYYKAGNKYVDYKKALDILKVNYGVKTVMVDSGPTLNAVLIENSLVDEIHLLIAPHLIGEKSAKMFSQLSLKSENVNLKLLEFRKLKKGIVLLSYKVLRK